MIPGIEFTTALTDVVDDVPLNLLPSPNNEPVERELVRRCALLSLTGGSGVRERIGATPSVFDDVEEVNDETEAPS